MVVWDRADAHSLMRDRADAHSLMGDRANAHTAWQEPSPYLQSFDG